MSKTITMLRRNAISLTAVAALALGAGGAITTAGAQRADGLTVGLAGTDVPVLRVAPYDRDFHLRPGDSPEMHKAWHTWKRLHDRRYETVVHRLCFCVPRKGVVTTVRFGLVDFVARTDDPATAIPRAGWTMDRFFYLLRHAQNTAASVDVSFGRQGVPRTITIDRIANAADDELYYRVHIDRL